mgnify:CR=1 FL=1
MASAGSPAVEPGFLFMCSNATFGECVSRSLLGESKEKLGLVQAVVKPSTPLLLPRPLLPSKPSPASPKPRQLAGFFVPGSEAKLEADRKGLLTPYTQDTA